MNGHGPSRLRRRLATRFSGVLTALAGASVVAAAAIPGVLIAGATVGTIENSGVFEVDGNIASPSATQPPYDWACVFMKPATATCPPPSSLMLSSVFKPDYATPDPTYFTSNKDIQDVSSWGCTTLNNPLSKDDILNAYGAAFVAPAGSTKAGHLLIYLAQERASNNGDSFAGFWLMQHQHQCSGSGSFSNGGHDVGDLLVVSNYTNGGTTSTVQLYRWDPSNPAAVNNLVEIGSGFTCGQSSSASSNDICAIANSGNVTEPWAPKGTLGANQFIEVGIDLSSNLLPPPTDAQGACFSDFLAETRSSQELTATLKDYTSDQFKFCVSPQVTTQQSARGTTAAAMTIEKGTAVTDQATLGAPLNGTPGGSVTYRLFSNATCTLPAVFTSGPKALSGGVVPASDPTPGTLPVGSYQWQAFYSGDVASGGHNSPSMSACGDEPLTILDASIAITPQTATNGVGTQHVFTITATVVPSSTHLDTAAITTSVSPAPTSQSSTCASPTLSANTATCTLTINSSAVATYTVNAAAVLGAGGITMDRSTDGSAGSHGPSGTGPATKNYVDASVAIGPSAVNEVGHQHIFTVTVTAIPGAATPVSFGTITASVSPAPSSQSTTCATPSINGNTATCTLTIDSSAAGTFTTNAAATVTIGGVVLHRSTDGSAGPAGPGGSGPAVKHYVDAAVSIGVSAVNPVNQAHVFTIVVTAIPGGASPVSFGAITPTIAPTPGTESTTCGTPTISGNTATCTLTVNSALPDTFAANVSADVTMGGVTVTRSTSGNSGPGGSGPATKTYVDASVGITPSAVNEVGHQHVFTVTVTALPSGATPVVFTSITPSVSPTPDLANSSTCAHPTVVANTATCTITINSSTAGVFTANATAAVSMGGVTVTRTTAGYAGPGGTGPATKTYVDASVAIAPSAVNEVGHQHVFTVTVTAIPAGATPVSFGTITPSVSPAPSSQSTTCSSPTINGTTATCTVTINSTRAATYTADVSAQVTMGGVTVTRSTSGNHGPGGSGSATKTYVDASIAITPATAVNEVGHSHVFTITATAIPSGATPVSFTSITASVSPAPASQSTTCASPVVNGNTATCTLTIDSTSVTTYTANATAVVDVGGVSVTRSTSGNHGPGGSGPAVKMYVDAAVSIGPPTAINVVGAPHTFTVTVTALPGGASPVSFGTITPSVTPAPTSMSTTCGSPVVMFAVATCTVTIDSTTAGLFTANVTAQVTMGGVTVTRSTSGNHGPGGSGPALKTYGVATIAIAPDAVNEVGHSHTFTITLTSVPGATTTINSITPSVAPTPSSMTSTCASPVVNGNIATCTVTIDSSSAGVFTATATAHITVNGFETTVTTDGLNGNSGAATKTYVDASIAITPATAVNEVGHSHVFTITATAIPSGATPVSFTSITASVSPPPASQSTTCATPTVSGNTATCTLTIDSGSVATFTANATAVVSMGGVSVTRSTSGNHGPGGSGPATKMYVDAAVSIGPPTAINVVGAPHVFTVTVTALPGDASPVSYGSITPTVTPAPTSMSTTCGSPVVLIVATCTVTIESSTAGVFTANVTAQVTMGGVTVTRSTSGNHGPGGSGPAHKTYGVATIAIAPDAVNEVGHSHTFTITVTSVPGTATTFNSIVPSITPTPGSTSTTCGAATVNGNVATCTVTIDSNSAGVFTATATADITVNGFETTVSTDGTGRNSGPAVKTYVDASVGIAPTAVNEVGRSHTFTVTVTAAAPKGMPVTFDSIVPAVTPTPNLPITSTCGAPVVTGDTATCTLTIDSSSAGLFTANAAAVVTAGGVTLHRSTDGTAGVSGPAGSGPAFKTYVDAAVGIGPSAVNPIGKEHVFDIVVTAIPAGATPVSFGAITTSVTPTPLTSSTTCGSPVITVDQATCTLTVNSDLPTTFSANVTALVTMGGVTVTRSTSGDHGPGGTGPATKTYVNALIQLTPAVATDPVGDIHTLTATVTQDDGSGAGAVPVPDGTVVSLSIASGPGTLSSPTCTTSGGTGTCTDTLTSAVAGATTIHATVTVTVKGVGLTRSTGDSVPGDGPDATKTWVKVSPSIATTQSAGGAPGTALSDTATVSGGHNPTGTVTFRLFAPGDTNCTGTAVFTDTPEPLSGGLAKSAAFTATASGTYQWVATYSGDAGNTTAVSGCGSEPVTISAPAAVVVKGLSVPLTGVGTAMGWGLLMILAGGLIVRVARRRRS